jgi:hypothetical protein
MSSTFKAIGLLAAALISACAAETAPSPPDATESADVVSSADRAIENEIADAINGLFTDGSEGDPDDYEIVTIKLRAGQTLTDAVILARIFPKLDGLEDFGDLTREPGMVEKPIAEAWKNVTAAPDAADYEDMATELAEARATVAKWKKVKTVFDRRLTNVRYFDMGFRTSYSGDSIENGTVAHVFLGQTPSGRVFAIYGIDIWT